MVKSTCSLQREETFVKSSTNTEDKLDGDLIADEELEQIKVRFSMQKITDGVANDQGVLVTEVDSGASNQSTPLEYKKYLYDYDEEGDDSPRAEPEMQHLMHEDACVNPDMFQNDSEFPAPENEDISESGVGITEDRIREIFLTSYTKEAKEDNEGSDTSEKGDDQDINENEDKIDSNEKEDMGSPNGRENIEEFEKTKKLEEKLNKALENIEKEEVEKDDEMSETELEQLKEKCMNRMKNAEQLCEYADGPSIKDFSSSKRLLDYLEKSVEKDEQTKCKVKTAAYSIKPDVPRMGDLLAKSVADLSEEILKLNLDLEEERKNNETLRIQFDQSTKISGDTVHQLNKEHAMKLEAQKKQYQVLYDIILLRYFFENLQ